MVFLLADLPGMMSRKVLKVNPASGMGLTGQPRRGGHSGTARGEEEEKKEVCNLM